MSDLSKFKQYYAVSAQLLDLASKEEMAEVMRLLALHVAHLERLYGPAPPSNLFELLGVQELTEEQAALLTDAMQVLTGYLAVYHSGGRHAGALAAIPAMYAISRIEAKPGIWCWAVAFRRRGKAYSKAFYDLRRGGSKKALAAAVGWRDQQLERVRRSPNKSSARSCDPPTAAVCLSSIS